MSQPEDVQFLALLVHRGHLDRSDAEKLLPRLKEGEDLDFLLECRPGWDAEKVRRLRVTRAGEEPRLPGYEILGRAGVGGTAEVFRAREKKSGRPVALKVLNPRCTADPRSLAQFVREAKLLSELDHPALCRGMGVKKSGDTYFAPLEMIEGRTLLEHLDEGHVFEEDVALRIVLEVAEVLAYLGEQGLVHRDVKPGNVMLTQNGAVKLIDLGFCAESGEENAADVATGTGEYLAPEQALGGACADLRSDIYSLGVTLFQLTIGRLPFESDADEDVLRKHVMEKLRSPELKGLGHSPHLHYFIEKMMAKEADVRYQSFDELVQDVRELLEGRDSADFRSEVRATSRSRKR